MLVVCDIESYYDKDYSLRRLTTEEYIRDPRFKVHGIGMKVNDQPSFYVWNEIPAFLKSIDWKNAFVCMHNARFDAAILNWKYGVRPRFLLDTLSLSRAVFPHESGSLANLSKLCGLGEKGNELVNTMGVRDLNEQQQVALGEYCINDVELTYKLFQTMKNGFPPSELRVIDQTLRMFTEPILELDSEVLAAHLQEVQAKQEALLAGRGLTSLRSNPQFAKLLDAYGVEAPTKISARTGKVTFAFAKTDEGFLRLLEHENEEVQTLAAARLGVKSSIEESRTKAFLGIAGRGALPIPLNYFGAQNTGRFAGSDSVNVQNLPRGGELRKSIIAPDGHLLVVSDFSSIEARMLAWLAGQEDLLEQFRHGVDVYCGFASRVYGREITKEDKKERFLGKVCLAEGTLVLCRCGWKPIERITLEDEVWDGENWVQHRGLLDNGTAQTLNLCGLWLTPDHQMWSGQEWITAQSVAADERILSRVLATGAANLPSQGTSWGYVAESLLSSSGAIAKMPNIELTTKTSRTSKVPGVICAPKSPGRKNTIGSMQKRCQTTTTGGGCSIGLLRRFLDAIRLRQNNMNIMGNAVSRSAMSGGRIGLRFLDTFKHLKDGIIQLWRSTESTPTEVTSREILGSQLDERTSATNEKSQTSKRPSQVYDLASAGPRNRFTVLSQSGPIIVHNCILGLGYSMGWRKLATMMASGPLGQAPILFSKADLDAMGGYIMELETGGITTKLKGVDLEIHCSAAKHLVDSYRELYSRIPGYWKTCEKILSAMSRGVNHQFGCLTTGQDFVLLPNGLKLQYRGLNNADDGWRYVGKRGEKQYLYSGKLAENITQALSRIVMTDAMLKVGEQYKVCMSVHDELACVVREGEEEEAGAFIENAMSQSPAWAPGLPIACEWSVGKSYGEAK